MEQLSFEITAELNKLTKGLDRASAKIESFAKRNEKRFKDFGQKAGKLGQQLSISLTAPLALLAAQSVRTFSTFDDQMRKVGVTAGATEEELKQLTDIAKELGRSTRFSAREAAQGLEFMALAGFTAEESIKAIPDVLNLAAASAIELGTASDIVTDTMSAFSISAEKAANVSDVLAKTQASANTTVLQLGEAFKFSTANAATFGQDLETLSSVLGIFADSGVKGSRAGTAFNAMIRDLKASADNGIISIANQNIALADSEGNFRDLVDIMSDVQRATDGLTQSQRSNALDAIFQEEAIRGVNILMTQGVDKVRNLREELYKSEGTALSFAEAMESGLGGSLRSLNAAFEGFSIELGQVLAPMVQKLSGYLQKLLNRFEQFSPTTKKIIVIVGAFVAALGPLLIVIGGIASALPTILTGLAALTGPIGLVIAAVGALTAIIISNWDTIKAWANDIANYFIELYNESVLFRLGVNQLIFIFKTMWNVAKFVFGALVTIVKTNFKILEDIFVGAGAILKDLLTFNFSNIDNSLKKFANSLTSNVGNGLKEIAEDAKALWEQLGNDAAQSVNDALSKEKIKPIDLTASEESKKQLTDDVANAVQAGVQKGIQGRAKETSGNIQSQGIQTNNNALQTDNSLINVITDATARLGIETAIMENKLLEFANNANDIIKNNVVNAFVGLGEVIGNALSGGGNVLQNVGQLLLGTMGSLLTQLGQQAIVLGLTIEGVKKALLSFGGLGAIAIGTVAVALGSAFKNSAQNLGSNLGGGGGTGANVGGGGVNNNFTQSFQSGTREIILKVRGRDLVAVLNNQTNFNNVLG